MRYNSILVGLLVIIASALIMSSCNDDIELFGEIAEIPVVYGFITGSDSAQFIRVERSFADPITGAIVLAKDENEVYFSDIEVYLTNTASSEQYLLERVNVIDEGFVRDAGDFLTDPNYVYKILTSDINLIPGDSYALEVKQADINIATATTKLLTDSRLTRPSSSGSRTISFINGSETAIRWISVQGASHYTLRFEMEIREENLVTGDIDIKRLSWNATSLLAALTTNSQETDLDGASFFNFIASNYETNFDVRRQFLNMNVTVTAFGSEIKEYLDLLNANSGITSAQEVPVFSNVEGGLGLFSSRSDVTLDGLGLSGTTTDSLYDGSITGQLNFTP